jgi:hypothetical protein
MPGNENEAAALLDAFLERQTVPQAVPQATEGLRRAKQGGS